MDGKTGLRHPSQLAVLRLVSMGRRTEEIAKLLGLGKATCAVI